jgi:hypothetical protein
MARKQPLPKYYAYFDKASGDILSVTNEKSQHYTNKLDIDYELYAKLVSGTEKFSDYSIGHLRSITGKTSLVISPRIGEEFIFKNTMLEIISPAIVTDPELTVTWNSKGNEWIFSVSPACKKRLVNGVADSHLVFFITLADDYNFLIRTIILDSSIILSAKKLCIPFSESIESQINKISIATKLVFQSYGLTVNE